MNKINYEKNRTKDMETWNRLIPVGGVERWGKWWTEREGISQRTFMKDTWTTERGLTVGENGGVEGA